MPSLTVEPDEMLNDSISTANIVKIIDRLLLMQNVKVDNLFADPLKRHTLMALVKKGCIESFEENNAHSMFNIQKVLYNLYNLTMKIPKEKNAQNSAVLVEVANLIEGFLLKAEDQYIDESLINQSPKDPIEYVKWIKQLIVNHDAFVHPLYNEYLKNDATKDDLRYFFIQETTVDARFDDILTLMQLGSDGQIKMEIANNFWDEMGNGNPEEVHTQLFNKVLSALNITDEELEAELSVEAMISGNISMYLSMYRKNFYQAVGFFAATEYIVPHRFKNLVKAWERNELDPDGIAYHRVHIVVDVQHAEGWFNNVVIPVIAEQPEKRFEITKGVLYRLNSSLRYLEYIYSKIKVLNK